MIDIARQSSADPADAMIDRAIAAVLSQPLPPESLESTINKALRAETTSPLATDLSRHRSKVALAMTLLAAAMVAIFVLTVWPTSNQRESNQPQASVPGSVAAGNDGAAAATQSFFMPGPATGALVAGVAPVLVTLGPSDPVDLGAVVTRQDLSKGVPPGFARLHIWNWSQSQQSRVIVVKKTPWGTLSPDGTMLLSRSGESLDLATGAVHTLGGLLVADGQSLTDLYFSPSGKYVAAMIQIRTDVEQVQRNPPLFSATHQWSLRLVDVASGTILGEYPAHALGGVAFLPDESSIFYSDSRHVITRREIATGKLLHAYQPALGIHGAVGMAISPAGDQLAVGYYHGEIYLWATHSGKLRLHQPFLRDDGEHDVFFQAKVMQFSPDGKLLAMASGNRLKIMETSTGRILRQHYHETTPPFMHLRWSTDGQTITLVASPDVAEYSDSPRFPPLPKSDRLPRLYEWSWQQGDPVLKAPSSAPRS